MKIVFVVLAFYAGAFAGQLWGEDRKNDWLVLDLVMAPMLIALLLVDGCCYWLLTRKEPK